jgi:glycosyltransferase involved in cell wall biosynthesis
VYKNVTKVVTDNERIIQIAKESFREDVFIKMHYIPTPIRKIEYQPRFDTIRILWASRIDFDKGFELLLEIAEQCPEFQFIAYGRIEDHFKLANPLPKKYPFEGPLLGFCESSLKTTMQMSFCLLRKLKECLMWY